MSELQGFDKEYTMEWVGGCRELCKGKCTPALKFDVLLLVCCSTEKSGSSLRVGHLLSLKSLVLVEWLVGELSGFLGAP